jgi:CHAT domain-containing protein/Tfp pilus assembly protein PilF
MLAALVLGAALAAAPASAQPYARFAVADSALAAVLETNAAQYEIVWNALFVAHLRAAHARADSAARLGALARRIAAAEPGALGSRIGADALALARRWTPMQRRARIAAAVAESLATAAQTARAFDRADSLFAAALRGYQTLGERRRVAWVWGSLGSVAFTRGDMTAADSLYRRALEARRALGDPRLIGNALNTLGSVNFNLRRHEAAARFLAEARRVRERTGERAALGTTINILGLVLAAQGLVDSAVTVFGEALALTAATGDSARTAEVLVNYAVVLRRTGDPARALPVLERALRNARARGDRRVQNVAEMGLGDLLRQQGHFAEAAARLEEAYALALALNDPARARNARLETGRVWIGLGDGAAARAPLERALAIADSLRDPAAQARALNNLAIAARIQGDETAARGFAPRALEAAVAAGDSSLVHDAATTLGELALDAGDLAVADVWFRRALGSGTEAGAVRAGDLDNLGAVAARAGRLDEAESWFREALALAEGARTPDLAWPAILGLGDVADRRGRPAEALAHDRRAAARIEALRARQGSERPSVRLLARRLFAFEALIHLLGKLAPAFPDSGYAAEAFHWSERARARAFLDLVAAGGGEAKDPPKPLTLPEAQLLLTVDRQAMLAYSVGDSSSSLWVITRREAKHVTLPSRRALRTRVELLRRGLADPQSAEARATHAAARALHRTLIEPALPLLKGVDHLIVAPDGVLALVPFEALLAADAPPDSPAPRGARLVERFAVSYTPSASALATRAGTAAGAAVVALGNPEFGSGGTPKLAPLPHTAAELSVLGRLAAGRPLATLSGRDATRERWLSLAELPRAALVHVATHGEANEAEPERSGLWLAAPDSAAAPGFVSVADILGLKLGAGLVTLSACETGLGRLEGGEGVIGLTRAFLAAGSRGVMVSLWKVNDASTALLMERFYRGYLGRGAEGARSLAEAKRALLKNQATRSPFQWAPFVLVGNAGKLGS